MLLNIGAAWAGLLAGIIAGAVSGLKIHSENYLGGYSNWTRRLVRLAHISFVGIAFINLGFGLTARALGMTSGLQAASILLVVGAITMPLVCYLAAFKQPFRHLFFIPVISVLTSVTVMLWKVMAL
jgi:hypothetical protein